MNYLRLISACTAAFLLSSCGGISWNLADRVAELPDSCVGVDVTQALELWVPQGQEDELIPESLVMLVPELTYTPQTHLVASGNWASMERLVARDVMLTGRRLWVQKNKREPRLKLLSGKPEGVVRYKRRNVQDPWSFSGANGINPKGIGHLSTTRSAWGPLATSAAVPLFVVDCGLGIVSNVSMVAVALVLLPVQIAGQQVVEQVAEAREGEKVLLWSEAPEKGAVPKEE